MSSYKTTELWPSLIIRWFLSYLYSFEFLQSLSQFQQSFQEYPFWLFVNSVFEKQKCFWLLNVLLKIQLFTFNFQWSFLPTNSVRMCLSIKQSLLTLMDKYFIKCKFKTYQLICKVRVYPIYTFYFHFRRFKRRKI
jgi:hypothetical protein